MSSQESKPSAISYWDYIKVPQLLSLQSGLEEDERDIGSDEMLFITVHQVYELWFKVALRDLRKGRDLFKQPHVPDDSLAGACRVLDRLVIIFRLCADHFPLVETLTTRDYLEFRDKLFPANGGQSPQFRELEILLGLGDDARVPYVGGESYRDVLKGDGSDQFAIERVDRQLGDSPTFKHALDEWLHRTPIDGSSPADAGDDLAVSRFIERYLTAHRQSLATLRDHAIALTPGDSDRQTMRKRYDGEMDEAARFLNAEDVDEETRPFRRRVRAATLFIEVYRELPLLAWPREVLDKVVAMEQAFIVYRQRHARMAERVIGRRIGTGGSSGVDYLDQVALKYRVFRDLWSVRTLLVRRDRLDDPVRPEFYGFRFGS